MTSNLSSAEITKASGSNLALSFVSLSEERRKAMVVFYAFCRIADDIVDEQPQGKEHAAGEINSWRAEIKACYEGIPSTQLGKELTEIIQKYHIPSQYFFDILDGVEMDLHTNRYETFADLYKYCYRVASAVGLVSIYIFGCKEQQTHDYAVALGMAFQLTNILRDVRQDLLEYGRIYLPQQEMKTFGVSEEDLKEGRFTEGCEKLFRLQYFRAKHFFNKARRLIHAKDFEHLSAALMMTVVYGDILEKIRKNRFNVLERKLKLSKIEKIAALSRAKKLAQTSPAKIAMPSKISVLGGGFSGISAAIHLAMQGHETSLYESKPFWGGRAHSFRDSKSGLTIDNGQHIFMGCYHASMELLDLLGVRAKLSEQKSLTLSFASLKNGITTLAAPDIVAPFHLLLGLFSFDEISFADKLSILALGIRIRLGCKPDNETSVEEWLRSWGQTGNAVRALWEPLCIAALNEHVITADAQLFYEVIKRSLFGTKADSAVYISNVGLSELLMPEAQLFLESVGSTVHLGERINHLHVENDSIRSFSTISEENIATDYYVSALPPNAVASLLPDSLPLKNKIRSLKSSPIISVHIWTDKKISNKPILGLLDSPLHWIFDRSDLNEGKDGYIYAVVISAAYQFSTKNAPELLALIKDEIMRLVPRVEDFKITHSVVYKSVDATFASTVGVNALRPAPKTPIKNLFLAGDWTDTSLPGTIESAILSGQRVSSALDKSIS